jgi:CDGSH-type Zn-finger protein
MVDESEPAASVAVYPDGPLIVRGDFSVCDVGGVQIETGSTVALCRCGRSAVKPFCDSSHKNGIRRDSATQDAAGSSPR